MKKILTECKKSFDPQYGFNLISIGELVIVIISEDQYGKPDIRLRSSDRNEFPGFGSRISEQEFKSHFKVLAN